MNDPVHVGCPACGAVNRLPKGRLADGGRCGSCHHKLFDGHPVATDEAAFRRPDLPSATP
jgi:thioredoxin 2